MIKAENTAENQICGFKRTIYEHIDEMQFLQCFQSQHAIRGTSNIPKDCSI
ncbi:hypothetical protein T12_12466 [Trichinella patagoniensis]|uniref:Uncharacterized protein n=1 Tax=Trichinella patagoniensis TaxID=990121 RepID=A0A0V0YPS1_9BILA|nr:hypothetical protein T12_12466 [Trichinella patagoniensis]